MSSESQSRIPTSKASREFLSGFLSAQLPDTRRDYIKRFKRLARFLGRAEERWLQAVEHLLTLGPRHALPKLHRFARWLRTRGLVGTGNEKGGGGFVVLTRRANDIGLIAWRYRGLRSDRRGRPRLQKRLETLLGEWRLHLENSNYHPSTVGGMVDRVRRLGGYLAIHRIDYRRLTLGTLEGWKARDLAKRLSAGALWGFLAATLAFYKWLVEIKVLRRNPIELLARVRRSPRPKIDVLSESEVRELLGACRAPRDQAMFELFYATGCRSGEIAGLDLDDLSLRIRRLRCLGKGRKERLAFFGRRAAKAIHAYLPWRDAVLVARKKQRERALFVSQYGNRIQASAIHEALKKTVRKTSIRKRTYPHLLRHSFATHLINRGASTFAVQALLGHGHPSTTAHYTRLGLKRIRRAYNAAHPWMRGRKGRH